jgi:hypothetical protein
VSVCVQALPSEQVVPLAASVAGEQVPVLGLHVPGTLHVPAGQVIGAPGAQAPAWQLSPTVQGLLSVQLVPLVAAAHAPVAVEQTVQPPHAAPLFCQVPVASQVCGCMPLHCFAPGVQTPVQAPPAQTYWQAAPVFCQAPFASQVCGCRLLHCLAVGVQTPAQVPVAFAQTYGQAVPVFCQAPFASQVCGCRALHCFALGVHAVQVPPLQTLGQAAPVFCQAPFASQVCGCSALHFFAPGVHVPLQAPAAQTYVQTVPLSCQVPLASHVCG